MINFFNIVKKDSKLTGRTKHHFTIGHPSYETHGHQQRRFICWPSYRAKRLPDTTDLKEESDVDDIKRAEKREKYAQGALIMFLPFQKLSDLLDDDDPSWWKSYCSRKERMENNEKACSILGNIQNFYESFCRTQKRTRTEFSQRRQSSSDHSVIGRRKRSYGRGH